ncbi:MAG: DnaJ domain-containing protein [Alphaproteobacteria bacterium]
MPYILLVIGLLIGVFALYRFFIRASVQEIKTFILAAITLTLCLALFVLSVTGRLPAAIAIVSAILPFAVAIYSNKAAKAARARAQQEGEASAKPMNRDEALNILGLKDGASAEEIESAYKKLMKKVHPDQEGSDWMAKKLNEARDFLVRK